MTIATAREAADRVLEASEGTALERAARVAVETVAPLPVVKRPSEMSFDTCKSGQNAIQGNQTQHEMLVRIVSASIRLGENCDSICAAKARLSMRHRSVPEWSSV